MLKSKRTLGDLLWAEKEKLTVRIFLCLHSLWESKASA